MLQVRVSIVRETRSTPSPEQTRPGPQPRWRRAAALGSVLALVAVALVGSAGANPATTDTTDVTFVAIPAKQVMGNVYIAAGKTYSVAVIDGATTVPSNATTVRLLVTVKGTKAGALKLYPAGTPAGTSGDTIPWTAGGTATATVAENVGMSNKVTVENGSLGVAYVTVKITGYSTQVTAGDINGSGGSNGQVLTNNGTGGATWQDAITDEGRAVATGLVKFVTTDGGSTYQPELVSSQTRNITAVRRSGFTPGYYCLTPAEGVTLTGRPAIGTPDWNSSPGDQLHVYVDSSNNECSAGELAVVTNTATGAARSILPFYIVIF